MNGIPKMLKDYYEICDDERKIDEALRDLRGYWKTLSILYLKKLKLPALDGIIVTRWSEFAYAAIIEFCKKKILKIFY